ncbi:hypothetical protein K7W42_15875 [Deinococcus sp. HMF7604]|uniref:hypothetical protein n=1 Tax=Deinococcus betulae TaxID=2873312 RepID=UPI001CCC3BC2|nr:hypothetical protein [Deinococcus betulae]MBZ9752330.1 hypothetical protein [Deinococcus betulae]
MQSESVSVLLAPGSDIGAAFAHWLPEAAAQAWAAGILLRGERLAAARLDFPGRTVLLQAALMAWPWGTGGRSRWNAALWTIWRGKPWAQWPPSPNGPAPKLPLTCQGQRHDV